LTLRNTAVNSYFAYKQSSGAHWHRFIKNIGGANTNFLGGNVVKTDKCMGVSQIFWPAPWQPQSLCLWLC